MVCNGNRIAGCRVSINPPLWDHCDPFHIVHYALLKRLSLHFLLVFSGEQVVPLEIIKRERLILKSLDLQLLKTSLQCGPGFNLI